MMFRPQPMGAVTPTPSASGDSYVWIGAADGTWAAPADWRDTTTGTSGISAPGSLDSVAINGGVGTAVMVSGGGAAAALTVSNVVSLEGNYQFGTLTIAGSLDLGLLDNPALGHVNVGTVTLDGGADLTLQQTALTVAGATTLSGLLSLGDRSTVQTGTLTLVNVPSSYAEPDILVDGTSALEVGHAGGAALGEVTVDAGATLSGSGGIGTGVVDNGVVAASGSLDGFTFIGTGQLRIDAYSDLSVSRVAAGVTIEFAGPGARLDINVSPSLNPISSDAPLIGFTVGDAIDLGPGSGVTSFTVTPTSGGESLSLLDGAGQVMETLTLRGATAATTYLLLPDPLLGTELYPDASTQLVAVPAEPMSGPPPAGTTGRDRYLWTGALGTNWGTAGNWQDTTQGGTASVAPGRHDEVTIAAAPNGVTVVTGVGEADTLTTAGAVGSSFIMDGQFTFQAITGAGTLIEGGAASLITAERLALKDASMIIDGASLRAGTDVGGYWTLLDGASVQVGTARFARRRHDRRHLAVRGRNGWRRASRRADHRRRGQGLRPVHHPGHGRRQRHPAKRQSDGLQRRQRGRRRACRDWRRRHAEQFLWAVRRHRRFPRTRCVAFGRLFQQRQSGAVHDARVCPGRRSVHEQF